MSEDEDDLLDVAPGLPHSNILSETLAYVIGLALALILTGVSFWVASTGVKKDERKALRCGPAPSPIITANS